VARLGDDGAVTFVRSSVKPQQALPLILEGAAARFSLTGRELAVACASHNGEPIHREAAASVLSKAGLDASHLKCGAHEPYGKEAARLLRERGERPSALHNNCSGKHAGMLAAALQLGAGPRGYERPEHPVQRHAAAAILELAGLTELPPPGTDGCGLPNHPLPLRALARAAARLADPGGGVSPPGRAAALERIGAAMMAEPFLVAGTGRCCTALMQAVPGLVAKTGAEGVYLAASRRLGLGVALKAEDGATRAAEVALLALLRRLGVLGEVVPAALARFQRPLLRNFAGDEVGHVAPAPGWPGP
jgi:L-asparaginase II